MVSVLVGLKKFENDAKLKSRISELLPVWEASYRYTNIRNQIIYAHTWLIENPERDKKDYVRFLGNWLRRADQQGFERRRMVATYSNYKEERPPDEEILTGEDIAAMRRVLQAPKELKEAL